MADCHVPSWMLAPWHRQNSLDHLHFPYTIYGFCFSHASVEFIHIGLGKVVKSCGAASDCVCDEGIIIGSDKSLKTGREYNGWKRTDLTSDIKRFLWWGSRGIWLSYLWSCTGREEAFNCCQCTCRYRHRSQPYQTLQDRICTHKATQRHR